MGSLLSNKAPQDIRGANDIAFFHRMECKACPLNAFDGKLEPTGVANPLVYILGEGAGANEIEEREQFVGQSGQLLRSYIPRKYKAGKLRFNNTVRSRPPHNATPDQIMIECCRPSVTRDIEQSKPKAIFGFGNVPLEWVSGGFSGITQWRGRKMPVKVGSHTCWYYPMFHPAYLLRNRRQGRPGIEEHIFGLDMQRAFEEVESLPTPVVHNPQDVTRNTELITGSNPSDVRRVREALGWAQAQPVIGFDYETNGIRPYNSDKVLLSAAVATGERAVAFALRHPEAAWTEAQLEEVEALWAEFLSTPGAVKVAHHLAFELEWTLKFFGEKPLRQSHWADTMAQAATIDERTGQKRGGAGPMSLEFLVQQYYGFNLKALFGVDRGNLINTPLETVLAYNAPDARYAALLYEQQAKVIRARGVQEPYELMMRSIPSVVFMQARGLPVNQKEVQRLRKKYDKEYERVEGELQDLDVVKQFERQKGEEFKPLSNPNVLYVLKDVMKRREILVEDKYTKKLKYSADEKVLEQINHPFARKLVQLRKINKQRSTYILPLLKGEPGTLVYEDGLIHGQFNTVFAESGRLSAQDPNLQNYPKRDTTAKEVRKPVEAWVNSRMASIDYGQIEARVIGMFTKDERFCKSLWERYDVHQEWAERLARAYPARIGGKKNLTDKTTMKAFRTDVKNQWTFPLFFGARMESAAGYLHIPIDVIKPLYNEFWRQFAGVKVWQEKQLEFYQEHGYVECLTGKRRHGPLTTNQILNSPVQGTAAALVIEAMSRLTETGDPVLQPEIQIHDDLTFARIPESRVDETVEKILDVMLKPVFSWINVPITAEVSLGSNWLEMEDAGTFSSDEWFK